ncbi:MAG: hypothetical protein KDK03_15780 [Rhodobacteraceae bacterium]|nr:hypothetical protein [Paracoccaceae bacterium]
MSILRTRIRSGRQASGVLAALACAAALAGCTYQPGNHMMAEYRADPSEVQQDLFFQPGRPELARGEGARLDSTLRSLVLRPSDDVIVNMPSSGSEVIDQRRVGIVRKTLSWTPARVLVVARPGFTLASHNPDTALVQVMRYGRVRVLCPSNGVDFTDDAFNRNALDIGCSNALNRAGMVAEARDLTMPEELDQGGASAAIRAVETERRGRVQKSVVRSIVE